MHIKDCRIKNFTVFKETEIEPCSGVNVFIGANGTGKTHLLKILYAMGQWHDYRESTASSQYDFVTAPVLLNGIFKPEDGRVGRLVRMGRGRQSAEIEVEWDSGLESVRLKPDEFYGDDNASQKFMAQVPHKTSVYIPPNDVLAIYPGFTASYEKRELAFDQTYYDLCKALSAAPLKSRSELLTQLINDLQEILQGRVVQKGERFYVEDEKTGKALEAHLLAEGHRKIASLVQLVRNGSISERGILLWDEPESSMNPRIIQHLGKVLRGLAHAGMQVFIATHDYLLTGELSLAAEYQTEPQAPIRFFALSRKGRGPVQADTGDTLADLEDNPILDEFAAHYRREQEAALTHMKRGESA